MLQMIKACENAGTSCTTENHKLSPGSVLDTFTVRVQSNQDVTILKEYVTYLIKENLFADNEKFPGWKFSSFQLGSRKYQS